MEHILVLSDTHRELGRAVEMYERLKEKFSFSFAVHCGDHIDDAFELEERLGLKVYAVPGNCDGAVDRETKVVETTCGNILLTHGHTESVRRSLTRLLYLAEENDCEAVCFGHTHVALIDSFDGILLVNPGSLTYPRDGNSGSVAVLHCSEGNGFSAEIFYYDDTKKEPPKKPRKKVRGGFLRGLMNYSDRL